MQKTILHIPNRCKSVSIKYDITDMKTISLFESLTRTTVKGFFPAENETVFIVDQGDIGKAIGKNGCNIQKLNNMMKKRIKVVEYNPDPLVFTANLCQPNKLSETTIEGDTITVTGATTKDKGRLIGRNSANQQRYEQILRNYFKEKTLKVV